MPGTKVVVDGVTIYFHGIVHSQDTAFDQGSGSEDLDEYIKNWVTDTYKVKKEGVVLESGFRRAYGLRYGDPACEDMVMNNLFKESVGKVLIDTGFVLLASAAMRLFRRKESLNSVLPNFLQKTMSARKSVEELVEFRKLYSRMPQPFLTVLFDKMVPTHALEKSIVMYRMGMQQVAGEEVVHFLCGMDHESHLTTLAKTEGLSRIGQQMFTKAGLEIEAKQLLEKMANLT